jgi:hypothetical protein
MGCSSSSPTPANDTQVSFAKDIMPIFVQSCTLSMSCHGQPNNAAQENLYLGDHVTNTPAIIAQTYMGLVGVASVEDPSMPLVTAGSTAQSYLSQKIGNTQGTLDSDCAKAPLCSMGCSTQNPCGTYMPYNGSPLDPTFVETINNWIAQGAKNN